jgi:hypothetical protein
MIVLPEGERFGMIVAVDGLEVLESGVVYALHGERIEFRFDDGDGPLSVQILFEDRRNTDWKVDYKAVSESEVVLTFVNFDNPLGLGNQKKLLEVGEYNGRRLYLRFFVIGTKESENMVFYYTWFLGAPASSEE